MEEPSRIGLRYNDIIAKFEADLEAGCRQRSLEPMNSFVAAKKIARIYQWAFECWEDSRCE